MANLSQIKREKMIAFLEALKEQHDDDESLMAINQIERELTAKKYGLVWEEHEEEVDVKMQTHIPVFTEVKEKEIVGDSDSDECNFLLEGDNLHSLKLLEKTHKGKIDVIYIDPPYNTGKKDFTYEDEYIDNNDGYMHSKWISFMSLRLKIANRLLSERGVIFISIDDNEVASLKLLCDEIFNEINYIGIVAIENNPKGRKNSNFISVSNDYLLIYAKNISRALFVENVPKDIKDLTQDEDGNYVHNSGKRVLVGKNNFNDNVSDFSSNKHYTIYYRSEDKNFILVKEKDISEQRSDLLATGYLRYYSYNKNGFVLNTYTSDKIQELFENGALDFKNGKIYEKNFSTSIRAKSIWTNKRYRAVVNNEPVDFSIDLKTTSAKQELANIFGKKGEVFSNPKNVGLLKMIITLFKDTDVMILDFFAGSGTTGQAVLELNQEDGGNRHFILCTNNENNICEQVTYQRLKTVITGKREDGSTYSDGLPANLKYYKTDFVAKDSEEIYDDLLEHIEEMIQLQYGIKIDKQKYVIIMDDDEMDEFERNFAQYDKLQALFINQDVLLSSSQEKLLNNLNTYTIPDCYFDFELREAGELW